jgi:hypothetical protein
MASRRLFPVRSITGWYPLTFLSSSRYAWRRMPQQAEKAVVPGLLQIFIA